MLTVLVTWFIVDRVGLGLDELGALDAGAWTPAMTPLLASSGLLLAAYFVSAALWGRIVADLGGPRISWVDAVRLFMIANLGRYLPGKVWQIAGLAALAKGRGVPAATATGAAILGQGIALAAATAIGMGALLSGPPGVRRWGIGASVLIAVCILLAAIPSVFRSVVGLWFRLARTEPPAELGSMHALRWLALYVLNWALYAASFWILTRSFGMSGDLIPVASAFAAAYVIGYVAVFAPAGAGVREAALIAFLTPYLGLGPSGMIAIVARIWTTLVEVVPAGLFWVWHMASDTSGQETKRGGSNE